MMAMLLLCGSAITAQEDFTPLFDGTSLKGWTPSEDKPESFSVRDGMIVIKGGKAHLYYTGGYHRSDFKNFELRLKVRTKSNSNSGVYFHTTYQKEGWPAVGFEAQVNSTHGDPRKTGSLYGIVNMWSPGDAEEPFVSRLNEKGEVFVYRESAPSTDDEWFDYAIRVEDETITIKVNGMTTVQWTEPEIWLKKRRIGHGTFALQAHDPHSEIHYKDIRVKVLD